ncbi:hypothetical protein BV898_15216 [Hypsibius exemplaris]|uniref:Protein sleepless n=1 Tax=Hypsibius exemplaris TaxID=2072580 RepID=A0A9X6RKA1_HYPEX|nr:hypothetical protein BV898_15216 [Hypsibius exemplaris]
MQSAPLLFCLIALLTSVNGGHSLLCYNNGGPNHAHQTANCGTSGLDTCWKFMGTIIDANRTVIRGQLTKKCVKMADMLGWTFGSNRGFRKPMGQNACQDVTSLLTEPDILTGMLCLCNDRDYCNASSNTRIPWPLMIGFSLVFFFTVISLQ